MTRIVSFADGFTSATAPSLAGSNAEDYTLLNNQASFVNTGLSFDSSEVTSAFAKFELSRADGAPSFYSQSGSFIAAYDGSTWSLEFGPFIGDEIIADALTNTYNMIIQITSGGVVQYQSGNMVGSSPTANLKLSITRISA